MKTVLITGGNSFLAKEFINSFTEYNLIITNKNTLDVTNKHQVDNFFYNNHVDYILHTAIKGGSRLREDTFQDFIDNLNMYNNLSNNCDKFELMFNFGSGAEFDRRREIKEVDEREIFNFSPSDYYGQSKNIIAREIHNKQNIINIRLFGCFGKHENETRFIKNCIKKSIKNEQILVPRRKMDFFYSEDLIILIKSLINNKIRHKDINAVYKNKLTLFDIAHVIKQIINSKSDIKLTDDSFLEYTGSSKKIDLLNLDFLGLENSIRHMIFKMDL